MKREYRRKSIKYKLLLLLIVIAIAFDVILTGVSYVVYTKNMNMENLRICSGVSEAIAADINPGQLAAWLDGKITENYEKTEEKIENVMKSFSGLESIKVCKMNETSMQIVFCVKRDSMKNTDYGKSISYDGVFSTVSNALYIGDYVDPISTEKSITSFTPIKNTSGKVISYVVCETSTEEMFSDRRVFISRFFATVGTVTVLFMVVAYIYMNRILIVPLNKIDLILRNFAEDNSLGDKTIEKLGKVKRHNIYEIDKTCDSFAKLVNDVSIKTNEVKDFDNEIMEKMKSVLTDKKPEDSPKEQKA